MRPVIQSIDADSPLRGKCAPGDKLLTLNGHPIQDVLDYKYYSYERQIQVGLERADGSKRLVLAKKPEGKDLGLNFETYLMDKARACKNRCLFCFVDQLPKGMRRTLYFKDDDARLSFLTGNYITLTNLSQREMDRIAALHVSPIHVSVHATEPALRAKLLGNPDGREGYARMEVRAAANITMHCQIVCCPGINAGAALQKSMEDLERLWPQVESVSIVPVGLTRHREGLAPLRPFDRAEAEKTIRQVEAFSQKCLEKHGSRIFFCADELYLKAGLPLPEDAWYEGYVQLENGVGMLRLLEVEFRAAMAVAEPEDCAGTPFAIATGVSAAPYLQKLLDSAGEKFPDLQGRVYPIVNDFLGHTIDVAGLVTGGDLIAQLRGKPLGQRLLIPQNMLRHGEGVFLDDVTLEDVQKALGVPVEPVIQDGGELFDAILR